MKTLVQFVFDGSIVLLHITRILVQMFLTSPKLKSLWTLMESFCRIKNCIIFSWLENADIDTKDSDFLDQWSSVSSVCLWNGWLRFDSRLGQAKDYKIGIHSFLL